MDPDYGLIGGLIGLGMFGLLSGGLLRPAKTKQERILERLDEAERIYLKRLASPQVKLAEAKRERKRLKLLKN